MRTSALCRLTLCVWAALLAGCGGAAPIVPAHFADAGRSWTDPQAKTGSLLYISDLGANSVDVYTYPGGAPVGKLTGFGSVAGLCADKGGTLFVVDEAGPVVVYAHGGTTPLRKLSTDGAPYGCSVDPVSGDLALTQLSSYSDGALAVYPKAKGKPKIYRDTKIDASWFCGYDAKGNLFADAWDRFGAMILVELPKGGKTLEEFKLSPKFDNPGGAMWDGAYVAVSNRGAGVIYRIGATGHIAHTVSLKTGDAVEQFWIDGSTLIGPNAESPGTVGFWHYPGGGAPFKTLKGFYYPFGAAVSVAK